MKYVLKLFVLLFISLLIWNCDNSTDTETIISQVLFFYADHDNYYWSEQVQEVVNVENTSGGGVIFADPLPSFENFKMGASTYSGDEYFNYYPGYLSFGEFNSDADVVIFSDLNPLEIEVNTSLGKLNGSIALPDTIESLSLSEYDTLELGRSFTISWSGSDADFFSVNCDYEWVDGDGNWQWVDLGEFVSGTSITYPGSIFAHNGVIEYIRVEPINGPMPGAGSKANMTGDGAGFLYYFVNQRYYEEDIIVVGTGLEYYKLAKTTYHPKNETHNRLKIKEKIESMILEID